MKIGIQSSGTTGDIRPFIQLADGLSKANHEVTLALTVFHKNDFMKYQKNYNFNIIDASNESCYSNADNLRNLGTEETAEYFSNIEICAEQASEKLCQENEIVIGNQGAHYLQAYAEKAGIPYITMSLNHSLIPTKYKPYIGQGLIDLGEEMNSQSWLAVENHINDNYTTIINEYRKKVGLGPVTNLFREVTHSPVLHLIGVSKVFCEPQRDWDNHRYVCGYFFLQDIDDTITLPDNVKEFITGGLPPIFFSLGSSNYFISNLTAIINDAIHSAETVNRKIIIQTTWDTLNKSELHLNDSVFQLPMGIDHRLLLPHCVVSIHHGGAGTSHTAILCGCPSIVIEDGGDMTFWAHLLNFVGVAPSPISRAEVTYDLLVDRLETVLSSPQMKTNAERLSEIIKSENPIDIAIRAINETFANNTKLNNCYDVQNAR
jgi:sterol 3beta-glucosyltransferase